jgi:hypothetical protein
MFRSENLWNFLSRLTVEIWGRRLMSQKFKVVANVVCPLGGAQSRTIAEALNVILIKFYQNWQLYLAEWYVVLLCFKFETNPYWNSRENPIFVKIQLQRSAVLIAHTLVSLAYLIRHLGVNCSGRQCQLRTLLFSLLTSFGTWAFSRQNCLMHRPLESKLPQWCEISKMCPPKPYRKPWSASPNMQVPTVGDVPLSRYWGRGSKWSQLWT